MVGTQIKDSYCRPKSLEEALKFRRDTLCTLVAGGTDIMVQYKGSPGTKLALSTPLLFVDQIDVLKQVEVNDGFIEIGAACTYSYLLDHEHIPEILKDAIRDIAAPAIRNRGTIGGNICNASPAGDTLPLLYVFDAQVVTQSFEGEKIIPISQFITGPRKISLDCTSLVTKIMIPVVKDSSYMFFEKIGNRKADAIAKVSIAGKMEVEHDKIKSVAFAFGAVGPTIVRDKTIESQLIGETFPLSKAKIEEIIKSYTSIINPITDHRSTADYRKRVALNLLELYLNMEEYNK